MRGIVRFSASRWAAAAVVALSLVAGAGCASSASPVDEPPRDRMGSLPFPGTFTLYRIADADRLVQHRYERTPRLFREDEGKHGIVYTTRAGFLDVGHIRITVDTVRYCSNHIREAIRAQSGEVALPTIE